MTGGTSRHSRVASATWGWRWEVVLGLVASGLFELGTRTLGGTGGGVLVTGAIGVALWSIPWTRARLAALLRERAVDRWFSRALRLCGVLGPWGTRPVVRESAALPAGTGLVVSVPVGHHTGHLADAAPALAATLRVREVRVVADVADASLAHVRVIRRDPLSSATPPWPWVAHGRTSLWERVPVGLDEEGQTVGVHLPEHNLLLGGEPGGGKSAALSLLAAGAALDPTVHLSLFDAKQVELSTWADVAARFVGPGMDDAALALGDLRHEMDARYERLLASRRRKITAGDNLALHVVVVDELAFFVRGGARAARVKVTEGLRDLVSRGRAAGIVVLAATQKPDHEIVPTWVRDLFGYRWALRCTTKEASDTVLGSGWASQGFSAASVAPEQRGVGFLLAEGGVPVKLRTFYLDDTALLVACKDRRALLCPACADRYQADAFHLVAAGLRGGKGVPASVAAHPACFVTLTAPSFGPVHSRPATDARTAPCRPRRRAPRCAHGVARSCGVHHRPGDARIGTPLCARCYDYEGAVLWNARVSLLWQRSTVAMKRAIAAAGGLSARRHASALRLSYVKVAEFQRRGLVSGHDAAAFMIEGGSAHLRTLRVNNVCG